MIAFLILGALVVLFPTLTGIYLVLSMSRRSFIGISTMLVASGIAYAVGYNLVPDFAALEGKGITSDIDSLMRLLTAFLVISPAGAAALMFRGSRATMYGFLGAAAAYVITVLANAVGLFGEFHLWAGHVGLIISAFMLCGYKLSNHWVCGVIVCLVLLPFIVIGNDLNLVQAALLLGVVAVAAVLTRWCLPATNWNDEVIKLAVAIKWRDEMWARIEDSVTNRLLIMRSDESLPTYTRDDIEFVMAEFTESSLKLQDQVAEVVLGLVNRRWSRSELASTWNNMIDARDPLLKPETASFKSLRKMHV